MILVGHALEMLRTLKSESVDSIVTDPPYELGFMSKAWDSSGIAFDPRVWRECRRVLKPGGHLLAFGGARTYHRIACAIEDGGFDIRDQIMWVYGSGFPKSLDISKAIDKAAGAEREIVGFSKGVTVAAEDNQHGGINRGAVGVKQKSIDVPVTAAATDEAKKWEGWGTALKPAHEPICVARKPFHVTVEENVRFYGTGALNIDGCRVPITDESYARNCSGDRGHDGTRSIDERGVTDIRTGGGKAADGRWPANLIHDGSDEVLDLFPSEAGAQAKVTTRNADKFRNTYGEFAGTEEDAPFYGDSGSAARFFYCAKVSRAERDMGMSGEDKPILWSSGTQNPGSFQSEGTKRAAKNNHPTVKPLALMRYLVRLVTPPGGIVLDPFGGSGTTCCACEAEGFGWIYIDKSAEYAEIARRRIDACRSVA